MSADEATSAGGQVENAATPRRHSLPPRGTLWELAACRGMDTDLFFPGRGQTAPEVIAVCEGCVVRAECLAFAIEHREDEGIWGGTYGRTRDRMRQARMAELGGVERRCNWCHGQFIAAPNEQMCSAACRSLARTETHRRRAAR